jgi:protein TonB
VPEPKRTTYVAPTYPADAKKAGAVGRVGVRLTIGPDGWVTDATVIRSNPRFDQVVLDAVRQWRFAPTTRNGVPVAVIVSVEVDVPATSR